MAHAKRLMRAYRQGFGAGFEFAQNAAKNAALEATGDPVESVDADE